LSAKIPLALIFLLLTLAVCAGCQQASGKQSTGEPKSEQRGRDEARAEDTEVAAEKASGVAARAGDGAETRADVSIEGVDQGASSHLKARAQSTATKGSAREATLEIAGDPGIRFYGTCTVGDEEREIGGRAPERFVYELDGRKLECEIRKQSPGVMNIVLDAGDVDYVQRTDSRQVTARIAYSGQGFSSSIQSSTSSGSTNQTNVSQSSSTIVSSSSKNSR
jgi:hypothetical protein